MDTRLVRKNGMAVKVMAAVAIVRLLYGITSNIIDKGVGEQLLSMLLLQ